MKLTSPRRVRWTTTDLFRMAESGLLEDRRVELIEGEILEMPAQATPHRAAITRISQLLLGSLHPSHWVVIQGTLLLSPHSAPDPDFHVFDVPIGTPDDRLPLPSLVIEVSDTSYLRDSGSKLRVYARAGIADYWIIHLAQPRVEVYRSPENPTGKRKDWRYADVQFFGRGQQVRPLHYPHLSFAVDDMLP